MNVLVRARLPRTGRVPRESTVTVQFWRPGANPRRDVPDREYPCAFTEGTGWTAEVPTTEWEPGRWVFRGHVAGGLAVGWGCGSVDITI